MPFLSQKSRKQLEGVDQVLIDILTVAIADSPFDFGIPPDGGVRTTARQQELYAQGRTKPGKKITWVDGIEKRSRHQEGKAFDIYAYVDGKATWDVKYYEPIARHLQKVAKEKFNVDLKWGGDFKITKDRPHFEI